MHYSHLLSTTLELTVGERESSTANSTKDLDIKPPISSDCTTSMYFTPPYSYAPSMNPRSLSLLWIWLGWSSTLNFTIKAFRDTSKTLYASTRPLSGPTTSSHNKLSYARSCFPSHSGSLFPSYRSHRLYSLSPNIFKQIGVWSRNYFFVSNVTSSFRATEKSVFIPGHQYLFHCIYKTYFMNKTHKWLTP